MAQLRLVLFYSLRFISDVTVASVALFPPTSLTPCWVGNAANMCRVAGETNRAAVFSNLPYWSSQFWEQNQFNPKARKTIQGKYLSTAIWRL